MNHYEVLGLERGATDQEIRRAYRRLVLETHPDRTGDTSTTDEFVKITEAYEVLHNRERRVHYDELLRINERLKGGQVPSTPKPRAEPKPPPPRPQPKAQPSPPPPRSRTQEAPPPASGGTRNFSVADDLVKLTAYLTRGRFNEAERLAQRLTKSAPQHPIPYAALGDIARFRGDMHEAAKMYAFAVQMDPHNATYQRKHEDALHAANAPSHRATVTQAQQNSSKSAVSIGTLLSGFCVAYVGLAPDRATLNSVPIISSWTTGLIVMMVVAGVCMGAALSMGGLLERPQVAQASSAMTTLPPAMALGMISAFSFWLAALVYGTVALSQNASNKSANRLVGTVFLLVLGFALACALGKVTDPVQTLAWGGNVIYVAAVVGWLFTDSVLDGSR